MKRVVTIVTITALLLPGCAHVPPKIDQRSLHGPRAAEVWTYRMVVRNGREPSFEERNQWSDQLDFRVSRYLADHPEIANSFDVSTFRFDRQVAVGMTKEQVLVLIGGPEGMSSDPAEIEKLAGRFWPAIKDQATEAWVYPLGWRFYFAGPRLIDITQYLPAK